jgi:hypothetical protein
VQLVPLTVAPQNGVVQNCELCTSGGISEQELPFNEQQLTADAVPTPTVNKPENATDKATADNENVRMEPS